MFVTVSLVPFKHQGVKMHCEHKLDSTVKQVTTAIIKKWVIARVSAQPHWRCYYLLLCLQQEVTGNCVWSLVKIYEMIKRVDGKHLNDTVNVKCCPSFVMVIWVCHLLRIFSNFILFSISSTLVDFDVFSLITVRMPRTGKIYSIFQIFFGI